MMHLDDGTLQAFLDDELAPPRRAEAAEHLLACPECKERYEALMQANALFSRSVALLDGDPPARAARSVAGGALGRRARAGTSSFVKAAGLVLALAAAASAAVPGSPVREWIERAVEPAPSPEQAEPERSTPARAVDEAPAPAGVSLAAAGGRLVVALSGLDGSVVRLTAVEGPRATVSVVGGDQDPSFRTRAGRVEVLGGAGGEVHVGLPLAVEGARLEVDGRGLAEVSAGEIRALAPADTVDGALIWR